MKNVITNIINLKRVSNGLHPKLRIKATYIVDDVSINSVYSASYTISYIGNEL